MSKKMISYVMISLILMLSITLAMGDVSSAEIKEIKKALGLTDIKISDDEFRYILNSPVNDYEDSTLLDSARAITLEKNYIESLQKADLKNTILLLDATKDVVGYTDSVTQVGTVGTTQWLGLGGEILKISVAAPVVIMSWKNIRMSEMIYGSPFTPGYVPLREAGWNDDEAWNDVYFSTFKGEIDRDFKTNQDKKILRELFRHAWILKQNPNYPTEVNDNAKILASIIRERLPESNDFWGSIFSSITKTIDGVKESIGGIKETIDGVKESIGGVKEYFINTPEERNVAQTLSPTLSVSPLSGQQGQTFSFSGNHYTQNGIVEWNVQKPDGEKYPPEDITGKVDGSGNFNHNYVSNCGSQIGIYTIWAIDKSTGKRSNDVTETITTSDSCVTPTNPTLSVSPLSGEQGQTFSFSGNQYTSNGIVEWNVQKPDGTTYVPEDITGKVDGSGNFNHNYVSSCGSQIGTYTIWAIDKSTGKKSNDVTEIITTSDDCVTLSDYEGKLLRQTGDFKVYLIEDGKKLHFTSPEVLEWNGYSFDDLIEVSEEVINSFELGADISIIQAIIDKYNALGGAATFGPPAGTGEQTGYPDNAGVICNYVNFQNGAIEYFTNGDLGGNAYAILNPFLSEWASMGYGNSVLGYPIDDMSDIQTSKFGTEFKYQNFKNGDENGSLEYNLATGEVFEIHGAIYATWSAIGYANSELGAVTSDERDALRSFKGTTGRVSDFENGHLHWHSSGDHAGTTYMTYGDLDALYVSMGGTDSWLGFPVMHQEDRGGYGYCEFEGGYIEWDGSGYIVKTSI